VKEGNDSSGSIFLRMKSFDSQFFEAYPRLFSEFDRAITNLNEMILQNDQDIEKLREEMRDLDDRLMAGGDLMNGLNHELKHVRERKEYFKNVWNQQVLGSEKLSAKITDI
jgi:uncharacterized protein YukE